MEKKNFSVLLVIFFKGEKKRYYDLWSRKIKNRMGKKKYKKLWEEKNKSTS